MTDVDSSQQASRIILRANRISFSSGARIGGGHFSIEARWGHSSISIGKRIYVFCGQGEALYSNTCVYDSTTSVWSEVNTVGKNPSSRYGHSSTYVEDNDIQKVMIFGGKNNKKYLNDLYSLDLRTMSWSTFHFEKNSPDARAGHTCTFIPSINGSEFPKTQSDTIRWIKPQIKGTSPSNRAAHSTNYIKDTNSLVIFGGFDGKRSLNDVFILNIKDMIWTQVRPTGILPAPRNGHTSVLVGGKFLVVHGGCNETSFLNDVHILDLELQHWISQPVIAGLTLFPRFHHTSNLLESGEMVVYGGCSSGVLYSDMCVIDLKPIIQKELVADQLTLAAPPLSPSLASQNQNSSPSPSPLSTSSSSSSSILSGVASSSTTSMPPISINSSTTTTTTTSTTTTAANTTSPNSISLTLDVGELKKSNPASYLEVQLSHALSLLKLEQNQKTMISNELQQTKEARIEAIRNAVEEQSKYHSLEKELSKIESLLKREQNEKIKAQESVSKLYNSLREKDSILKSCQDILVIMKQNGIKDQYFESIDKKENINQILNQFSILNLSDNKALKGISENIINKSLENQVLELTKEVNRLKSQLDAQSSRDSHHLKLENILQQKFLQQSSNHGSTTTTTGSTPPQTTIYNIKVENILGEQLGDLSMQDLDRLEEFYHVALKNVGLSKQNLLQQQLLKLQKEREESSFANNNTCLVCADRSINVVLLPCKHRCLCNICSKQLSICPLFLGFILLQLSEGSRLFNNLYNAELYGETEDRIPLEPNPEDYTYVIFATLAYGVDNDSGEVRTMKYKGECIEWQVLADDLADNRLVVLYNYKLHKVVLAFKGSSSNSDWFLDFSFIPTSFQVNNHSFGEVHVGFLQAYKKIRDEVDPVLQTIAPNYELIITGHSLGGAVAYFMALDFGTRTEEQNKNITSIQLITFGQPPVGFLDHTSKAHPIFTKIPYRRYVNFNGIYPDIFAILPNIVLFQHAVNSINLHCRSLECTLNPMNLHHTDRYSEELMTRDYQQCAADCYFKQTKFINIGELLPLGTPLFCPTSEQSKLYAMIDPSVFSKIIPLSIGGLTNLVPDIVAQPVTVCLFSSREEFMSYKKDPKIPCHTNPPVKDRNYTILFERVTKKATAERDIKTKESYIVFEKHPLLGVIPNPMLQYTMNFTSAQVLPEPPQNLTASFIRVGENFNITLTWEAPLHVNSIKNVTYRVNLAEIEKTQKVFKFSELPTTKHFIKEITVPAGAYSIECFLIEDTIPSPPSNSVSVAEKQTPPPNLSFSPTPTTTGEDSFEETPSEEPTTKKPDPKHKNSHGHKKKK
eukprot:gene5336-6656_t